MSDNQVVLRGQVTDVFSHRFVVKTPNGKILADLGPKGAERLTLKEGDQVDLVGEKKPSELKVLSIARNGEPRVEIAHPPKPGQRTRGDEDADPQMALNCAQTNGFVVVGRPRRKPKHFEVLGRDASGGCFEIHVNLDGSIRQKRPVPKYDRKWHSEIQER